MLVTFSCTTLVCPVVSIGPADQGMTEFSLCDFKLGQLKRLEHWASTEREAGRSSEAALVEGQVTALTDRCLPVPRCSQWSVPPVSRDLSCLSYCQRNPGLRRAERVKSLQLQSLQGTGETQSIHWGLILVYDGKTLSKSFCLPPFLSSIGTVHEKQCL